MSLQRSLLLWCWLIIFCSGHIKPKISTMATTILKTSSIGANPALDAKHLLDTISQAKNIATVLDEIRNNHGDKLPKYVVKNLELLSQSANHMHKNGRKQVVKVSPVSNLLQGYDMRVKSDRGKELQRPINTKLSDAMWRTREYVSKCNSSDNGQTSPSKPKPVEEAELPFQSAKKPRRSVRVATITPEKEMQNAAITQLNKGIPPNGDKEWTKETLIVAMSQLDNAGEKQGTFVTNVIASGKTPITTSGGIYKLYRNWKKNKVVRNVGRPETMTVDEAEAVVKQVMTEHTTDSNRFRLKNMTSKLEQKKKEKAEVDGLDPDSVNCAVSNKTAKATMVAVAMGEDNGIGLTNSKGMTKTESRFISEHSIFMGYAYAATVLSTHCIEGNAPRHMIRKWKPDELSDYAKETMEWMKKAMNADKIFPVDPNLVLSTDDTTLFVFEGTVKGDEDDWQWKLVDQTQGDRSVRSDFEVGDDAENSGGLRVRLTFTFTASGLAAPPYVAVSGLTDEELSPELCPDGMLATEVPHLCKGGNDLFNEGKGWLVFLRADKKNNDAEQNEEYLSIANKKFSKYRAFFVILCGCDV